MESLREFARRNADRLHVLPIGIGYAFTTRYFHASFMVICGGRIILIDAPSPLGRALREATERAGLEGSLQDIDKLFLTHLHGDHCNGVEELGYWRKYVGEGDRPEVLIEEGQQHHLWQHRLYASMGQMPKEEGEEKKISDYFRLSPFGVGATIDLGIPGLQLETRRTGHSLPCVGFRLSYNGRNLGYSADTPYDPGMIEFLKDCDLIIHETSPSEVHTPLGKLEALPEELRARIRLIHLDDEFEQGRTTIKALKEGEMVEV